MSRAVIGVALALFAAVTDGSAPRQVSESPRAAYEASLTPRPDGFAVSWYDTRGERPEIYFRLLDRLGSPAGPERRIVSAAGAAYEPDVAAFGRNIAVAWYERTGMGTNRPMLGLWTPDGRALWTRPLTAEGHTGRNPVVRAVGARLFCAWIDYEDAGRPGVHAGWFDANGRPLVPAQRLAPASRTTWNLNAAIDADGRAWVVFDAQAGTKADELFLARVDASASQVTRLTQDDGKASKYPDIAFIHDRAALTWFDERDGNQEVYLFVAPPPELHEGLERQARRVTNTPGASIGAYLAWNGRKVGLAWCDDTEGQDEIYFEPFDDRGRPLAAAKRLTDNRTRSLIPAIRPSGAGFALAWNELMPGEHGAHDEDGGRGNVFVTLVR